MSHRGRSFHVNERGPDMPVTIRQARPDRWVDQVLDGISTSGRKHPTEGSVRALIDASRRLAEAYRDLRDDHLGSGCMCRQELQLQHQREIDQLRQEVRRVRRHLVDVDALLERIDASPVLTIQRGVQAPEASLRGREDYG